MLSVDFFVQLLSVNTSQLANCFPVVHVDPAVHPGCCFTFLHFTIHAHVVIIPWATMSMSLLINLSSFRLIVTLLSEWMTGGIDCS